MNTFSFKYFTIPMLLTVIYTVMASFMFSKTAPNGATLSLQILPTITLLFVTITLFAIEYNQTKLTKNTLIYSIVLSLLIIALDYGIFLFNAYLWHKFYYFFYNQAIYLYTAIGTLLNLIKVAIALGVSYYYFEHYTNNDSLLSRKQINLITLISYSIIMAYPTYTWTAYKKILSQSFNLNILLVNSISTIILLISITIFFIYFYAWNIRSLKKLSLQHYALKTSAFCLLTYALYTLLLTSLLTLQMFIMSSANYLPTLVYLLAIPTFLFFLMKGHLMIYKIIHCTIYILPLTYLSNTAESLLTQPNYINLYAYFIGYISIVFWSIYGANQLSMKLIFKQNAN